MATAYLFERIIDMTKAEVDQQHIEILIHNCPAIPDRTQYILGKSQENPLELMGQIGRKLAKEVDILALPCITAHYFHEELEAIVGVPIIHAVRETACYLHERGYDKVGVMATDGTVEMGIFTKELAKYGIECLYPDEKGQRDVMHLIYHNVKAGCKIEQPLLDSVSQNLFGRGAQVIILGCTELSMIKKNNMIGAKYLDVTEVLAKCCVEKCSVLKEEYRELISI